MSKPGIELTVFEKYLEVIYGLSCRDGNPVTIDDIASMERFPFANALGKYKLCSIKESKNGVYPEPLFRAPIYSFAKLSSIIITIFGLLPTETSPSSSYAQQERTKEENA